MGLAKNMFGLCLNNFGVGNDGGKLNLIRTFYTCGFREDAFRVFCIHIQTSAVAQHRLRQSSLLKICVDQSQAPKLVTEDRRTDKDGQRKK